MKSGRLNDLEVTSIKHEVAETINYDEVFRSICKWKSQNFGRNTICIGFLLRPKFFFTRPKFARPKYGSPKYVLMRNTDSVKRARLKFGTRALEALGEALYICTARPLIAFKKIVSFMIVPRIAFYLPLLSRNTHPFCFNFCSILQFL